MTASILLADLKRRGFFQPPGGIKDIIAASKLVSEILYADDINRDAGNEPEMAEPNLVTIMDPPDAWGVRHNLGLAELAARLGSIHTFDRRGDVIWMDNFENGIEAWTRDGLAGYSVSWDSNYAKTGGFSCKLMTGAVIDRTAYIRKHIAFPVAGLLGAEISYSRKQNWKYLIIELSLLDGVNEFVARIRYDCVNNKLQYSDTVPAYQDIPGGVYTAPGLPEQFDTLKIVADFTTAKYKRLLVNSQVFDLSALSFFRSGLVVPPRMYITITLTTNIAAAAIGYIDDVITTQNEPA